MCRKIDALKRTTRRGWPVLLLLLGGCASDLRVPLFDLDVDLPAFFAEKEEQRVPVVYPSEEVQEENETSLAGAYGPAWRDLHDSYPEYQFN